MIEDERTPEEQDADLALREQALVIIATEPTPIASAADLPDDVRSDLIEDVQ